MNVEYLVDENLLFVIYKCFRWFICNKYFYLKYYLGIKFLENMNRNSCYIWIILNIIKIVNFFLDFWFLIYSGYFLIKVIIFYGIKFVVLFFIVF